MNRHIISYLIWFSNSFLAVFLFTPLLRRAAHRLGLVDHPGGQSYKWHEQPTAYLGGAAILLSVGVAAVSSQTPHAQVFVIFFGAVACGAVGLWDDWRPIGVWVKFLAPVAGAVALWLVHIRVGLTGMQAVDLLLTVLWVAGVTHALNIIDNMDGVAVGIAGIAAIAFFAIAVTHQETRVALMAASIAGGCLGFLPFNFRPATVFLGDAGSLSLGFLLASLGLANDLPGSPHIARVAVPSLVLGVPLFNLVLVVFSRLRGRRRITVGGTDGTAHRLVALGLSRHSAAMVFWFAAILLGVVGLVASVASATAVIAIVAVSIVAGIISVWLFERVPLELGSMSSAPAATAPEEVAKAYDIEATNLRAGDPYPEIFQEDATDRPVPTLHHPPTDWQRRTRRDS